MKYGYNVSKGHYMRTHTKMRLKCPACKIKARIYTHPASTEEVSSVYAKCTNHSCEKNGHSFVTQVAFTHWVDPKVAAVQISLDLLFQNLPADAQKQFLATASQSMQSS
ncbi:Phage transcriptional activator [Oleispira antarctica RB-8]|uniref:Phage transcriptional activator n=1 Tax=Oleispira antarctica RB-8 TaxID=698738 RepID=R4YKZ3_OLEAN|nr:Phage transcriptional activator [Oleispira antarctica RB-8]